MYFQQNTLIANILQGIDGLYSVRSREKKLNILFGKNSGILLLNMALHSVQSVCKTGRVTYLLHGAESFLIS